MDSRWSILSGTHIIFFLILYDFCTIFFQIDLCAGWLKCEYIRYIKEIFFWYFGIWWATTCSKFTYLLNPKLQHVIYDCRKFIHFQGQVLFIQLGLISSTFSPNFLFVQKLLFWQVTFGKQRTNLRSFLGHKFCKCRWTNVG